jgi:hypothetical protein
MNYLEIARRALAEDESDERDEKGANDLEPIAEIHASPSAAHRALATRHGSWEPVETTIPPPGWDRTLTDECGWPQLCCVLGPCPRSVAGGSCRLDGP